MISRLLAAITRLYTGLQVRWAGCEPSTRQRVYFANHTSHLDTLALWAALPDEVRSMTRPAAARDYWEAGRLRRLLAVHLLHAVLIDRTDISRAHNPLDLILNAMGNRCSLILFPEGTRNPGPEVGEFKCGLYHISRAKPGLELVPAYLANLNRVLPKGEALPIPLLCSVNFGPPLRLLPGESKSAFLARARQAVADLRPA